MCAASRLPTTVGSCGTQSSQAGGFQNLIDRGHEEPGGLSGGLLPNMQIKLSVLAVTVRACARPAPARPAAYLRR